MVKATVEKRPLKFNSLDDIMDEVRALADSGYTTRGNWTLAQACGHLADWMRFPMDGFPKAPLLMRPIFWLMKYTIAPGMKRKILIEGFSGGMPTDPKTVPKPDAMTDQQAIEELQKIVDRVKSHTGELHASPLFGQTDKQMHETVSKLHAEHHLGYFEPKQA